MLRDLGLCSRFLGAEFVFESSKPREGPQMSMSKFIEFLSFWTAADVRVAQPAAEAGRERLRNTG